MKPSIKQFEGYLKSLHHTPSTIKSYVFIISRYLQSNPNATNYGYAEIFKYITTFVAGKGIRPSMSLLQAALKKYYGYLVNKGYRDIHPCRSLRLFQKRKLTIIQDLFSMKELQLLMNRDERYNILRNRNKMMVSFMIYQGLNSGELKNLKLQHIDLDKSCVRIIKKRNSLGRVLEMTPNQIKDYIHYLKDRNNILQSQTGRTCSGDTDRLIINKLGNAITSDDIHYTISTFAGLFPDRKLTPTSIRQSVIANWLNVNKLAVEQVQLMAGHKNPSTTLRYKQIDIVRYVSFINEFHPL